MKLHGLALVVLFLFTHFQVTSAQNSWYTNTYELSGAIIVPDVGRFQISGTLEIETMTTDDKIEYINSYDATFGDYFERGEVIIIEETSSKEIIYSPEYDGIITQLWENLSNYGELAIYSPYRVTEKEIDDRRINILNLTTTTIETRGFFSPSLGYTIDAYKVVLELYPEIFIDIFYDTRHLVLLGYELNFFYSDENGDFVIDTTMILSDSTLDLPRSSAREVLILSYSVSISIFIIIVILFIRSRSNNDDIIDGGM